jgi:putative PIN family toxin of toxin-antitoxin system
MRIVLDTNVLISGIFFRGPSYRILQAWKAKKVQFVISPEIYSEYSRVAEIISKKYQGIDISEILNLIAIYSEISQSYNLPEPVCEDPDDDKFIACAISNKVRYIVSGDKHLLKLSGYQGIKVIKPQEFNSEFLA